MKQFFSEEIKNLPQADIPFSGVKGWLLQGSDSQLVFFEIEAVGLVPEHSHGAQWGVVIEGEVILTVEGITTGYKKGETYYIPGGARHSARFDVFTRVIDFFAEKERYKAKS